MRKKKGQAMVEVALMLPFLAFILCGIADFGRILFAANNINMVTQEAVRYASFNKTNDEVETLAKSNCSLSEKETKLVVETTPGDAPRESGVNVTVNVSYTIDYITPIMQSIIGSPFIVRASSTIRVE